MNEYPFAYTITAAAQALSEGRSTDEINIMAVFFTQLGDTLATISLLRDQNQREI